MFKGFLFGADRDLCIAVGSLQTYVAKPGANDIDLHAGFQQMYCRAVPP